MKKIAAAFFILFLSNPIYAQSAGKVSLLVAYGKDGSNLGYPDGVKVWNNFKKGRTTLEISWNAKIIGWITE